MSAPQQLRHEKRSARRALSVREQRRHSSAVAHRLTTWTAFREAASIAVYVSADGELDLGPLVHHAWRAGKKVYLPVLHPFAGSKLWFSEWRSNDRLHLNRFAIPEPIPRYRKPVLPWHLDMVLMPLVAFNTRCVRLGMGGGYYDRTFAYRNRHPSLRRPLLVGVAHELQRVDELDSKPWDIVADAMITERAIYCC